MPRIALYARVSTNEQRSDDQIRALRRYTKQRGWKAVEFLDHGVSGRQDRRAGLDEMMAAVRRREVDAVAITKLDRLARSTRHLCELSDELKAVGADLTSSTRRSTRVRRPGSCSSTYLQPWPSSRRASSESKR